MDILLSDNGQSKILNDSFFYDYNKTHHVTNISKTKLNVVGNEIITINGTFSSEDIKVYIGSKRAIIISAENGTIQIQTPSNEPGFYPLIIPIDSYGNAK